MDKHSIKNVIECLETALEDKKVELFVYNRDYAGYIDREGSRWNIEVKSLTDELQRIEFCLQEMRSSMDQLEHAVRYGYTFCDQDRNKMKTTVNGCWYAYMRDVLKISCRETPNG